MEDRLNYVKSLGEIGKVIELLGGKYEKASQRELKNLNDIELLKGDWMKIVEEFREEQRKIKQFQTPVGCEGDVNELNQIHKKYIDAIEEKSKKFSVEAMNSGELDSIQKRELKASAEIKKWSEETASKWFK